MTKKRSKRARSKRKHQHAPKSKVVWKQTAEEATLANKPYINAYACGHGVQGDTKYNRTKEKRTWKRDLQEGASRGSFPLCAKKFARALDPLVASRPMMPLEDTYGAMV